jgi:hypothetical protein
MNGTGVYRQFIRKAVRLGSQAASACTANDSRARTATCNDHKSREKSGSSMGRFGTALNDLLSNGPLDLLDRN